MTQTLDGHLFITLNGKKIDPQTEKLLKWKTHSLCLARSSLQTCPSLITKVGEQLADYFPCGGFVVTSDRSGGGKYFVKVGFQVLKREIFVMVYFDEQEYVCHSNAEGTLNSGLQKKRQQCVSFLQISNPAIQNLELFHCSATSSQIKSNDLDNFQNWQKWWD